MPGEMGVACMSTTGVESGTEFCGSLGRCQGSDCLTHGSCMVQTAKTNIFRFLSISQSTTLPVRPDDMTCKACTGATYCYSRTL